MKQSAPLVALAALFLLGCGNPTQATLNPAGPYVETVETSPWRNDRADLLNYFLGHKRDNLALGSREAGHSLTLEWAGNELAGDSRYTKWQNAHEHHRWDAANIYLMEDSSDGTGGHYTFTSGLWVPRRATPGSRGRNESNLITRYDKDCNRISEPKPFRFEWYFEGFVTEDFGGVVGAQEAAVVRYIWGPGSEERFFYAWDWGWVRWQYVEQGQIRHSFTFNKAGWPALSYGTECQ